MVIGTAQSDRFGGAWTAVTALVGTDGCGREAFAASLLSPGAAMRDLADAAHCLCLLHGRYPGVVETSAQRTTLPAADHWLGQAVAGFAEERATLVRLVAAVGPLPSTPGQAESEAAIASQRHALDMLAGSDRAGCPVGAALALVLDWAAIRDVLDAVAVRTGLTLPPSTLPGRRESADLVAALAGTAALERAMLFGAQQLLAQHHALWHLLEARAAARTAV